MKHLKTLSMLGLSVMMSITPMLARAEVVSPEEMTRITNLAQSLANGCTLTQSIASGQTLAMSGRVPEWKTLITKSGVSISFPWSPYWYIVGKQINWYEKFSDTSFGVGLYQAEDACGLGRKYYIDILANETMAHYFATPTDGTSNGKILEQFTLNGKKAALIENTGGFCDSQSIAVEVVKYWKTQTVVISHACGDVDMEMMRMATKVK